MVLRPNFIVARGDPPMLMATSVPKAVSTNMLPVDSFGHRHATGSRRSRSAGMRLLKCGLVATFALTGCGDAPDPDAVALGARVYAEHCAACHGARLEGEQNWRQPGPDGRRRAPPHDDSGHTWHHSDRWLFQFVENGPKRPAGKGSDVAESHAYGQILSNAEIRAVVRYINSHWSDETLRKRDDLFKRRRSTSERLIDHFRK